MHIDADTRLLRGALLVVSFELVVLIVARCAPDNGHLIHVPLPNQAIISSRSHAPNTPLPASTSFLEIFHTQPGIIEIALEASPKLFDHTRLLHTIDNSFSLLFTLFPVQFVASDSRFRREDTLLFQICQEALIKLQEIISS